MKKGISPTIWMLIVIIIAVITAYVLIKVFGVNIGATSETAKTAITGAGGGILDIIKKIPI